MSGGGDDIVYHFGSISEGAAAIDSFVQSMHNELSTVEQNFNSLRSQWTSGAAQNFDVCRSSWNSGARDMADHLLTLSKCVEGVGNAMQSADNEAAKLFPS